MKTLLFFVAVPLLGQPAKNVQASCSGNQVAITWQTTRPELWVRIDTDPPGQVFPPLINGKPSPAFRQARVTIERIWQQPITPGTTYIAYLTDPGDDWAETTAIRFTCAPSAGITIMVDGKVVATGVTVLNYIHCPGPPECTAANPQPKPGQVDILVNQ